ncbi:MAG: protoheme IX farnesyltransferase [Gammaproteobacteria bacterium]|nr:MAG: protoheme IX farnesyltransferase [Gammaproteobacteria bacterium]UCH39834.1 MAG: protoheme IX farnesyltransferase [Gammaproteobacteria bacterium]
MSTLTLASWSQYYNLTKPKVVLLIVFTAMVGMLLAADGAVSLDIFVFGLLGIGLAAASGAAINHVVDEHIDRIMERTRNRPLVSGELDQKSALIFALAIGALGISMLVVFVNLLTAILTFFSLVGYALIYTMYLKRATPQNIVLGGAAGAAPPLLGWTAVTGSVDTEALLLFLIIFIWTPPHFWALAIRRREEYAKADIPMLPVTHGVTFTKIQILLYTILLFIVTMMPFLVQMSGLIYLSGAIALGVGFLYYAIMLYREKQPNVIAMKTFGYSIFYLSLLFAFFLADHYARVFIRGWFL